jgi:hypothetical protein
VYRLSMYALQEEIYMSKHASERSRGLRGCLRNIMGVHLMGIHLMGVHLMGVSHRRIPHGRASHGRAPHGAYTSWGIYLIYESS